MQWLDTSRWGASRIKNAALVGIPAAAHRLACLYHFGWHVVENRDIACFLYERAATAAIPLASYQYGAWLIRGENIAKDIERGVHFVTLAAQNNCGFAFKISAVHLWIGRYCRRNPQAALTFMKLHQNSGENLTDQSFAELASPAFGLTENDRHACREFGQAFFSYLKNHEGECTSDLRDQNHHATNRQNFDEFLTGRALLDCNSEQFNAVEGLFWIQTAIDSGSADAAIWLADQLSNGHPWLPRDLEEACHLIAKEAGWGDRDAIAYREKMLKDPTCRSILANLPKPDELLTRKIVPDDFILDASET